jgi:hypothetical protein
VRKSILFAAGAAVTLAGTAIAANQKTHVMNVALPDGSVARIQYAGDVAPTVTVAPRPMAGFDAAWSPMAPPSLAGFDRMIEQMNRQSEAMIRQAQEMARQAPSAPGAAPYVASYGNLPSGATSTSVVSVSNGAGSCTRTTEIVSQGAGKAPKVTSSVSGNCAAATGPARPQAERPSAAQIDRT